MDQNQRKFIDKIRSDIAFLEKAQDRDMQKLLDRKISKSDLAANIQEDIDRRNSQLAVLQDKLDKSISGEISYSSEEKTISKTKRNINFENKSKSLVFAETIKTVHKEYEYEVSERDVNYQLERMYKITDSLPNFIKNNLREMPNNKGYIWKGCWFLGQLDEEPYQPTIMFEKMRDNILYIHEYYPHEYRLYEKQGKDRKKLIKKKPRKKVY